MEICCCSGCSIDLLQLLNNIQLGVGNHIVRALLRTEQQDPVGCHTAAVVVGFVAADVHNIAADAVQLRNVRRCGVRGQNQVVVGVVDGAQADGDFLSAVHAGPAVAAAAWHPVAHHTFTLLRIGALSNVPGAEKVLCVVFGNCTIL